MHRLLVFFEIGSECAHVNGCVVGRNAALANEAARDGRHVAVIENNGQLAGLLAEHVHQDLRDRSRAAERQVDEQESVRAMGGHEKSFVREAAQAKAGGFLYVGDRTH